MTDKHQIIKWLHRNGFVQTDTSVTQPTYSNRTRTKRIWLNPEEFFCETRQPGAHRYTALWMGRYKHVTIVSHALVGLQYV